MEDLLKQIDEDRGVIAAQKALEKILKNAVPMIEIVDGKLISIGYDEPTQSRIDFLNELLIRRINLIRSSYETQTRP